MKSIAIIQSNYIPWKGYFDIINAVDEFILLDNVQYTRRDWRNRNKIKSPAGTTWLSIPVRIKGKYEQLVCETELDGVQWIRKHVAAIHHNYSKTPFFKKISPHIQEMYAACESETMLSKINHIFISGLSKLLGIDTPITWAMDYEPLSSDPSGRLLELCQKAGANVYLSGPAARGYLDVEAFNALGMRVEWMRYDYPEYPQPYPPFTHQVSVIDTLLCLGREEASRQVLQFTLTSIA